MAIYKVQKLMKREEKIKREKKEKRINKKKRVGKGRKKIKGIIVQMDDYGKKEGNWKMIHKRQRG